MNTNNSDTKESIVQHITAYLEGQCNFHELIISCKKEMKLVGKEGNSQIIEAIQRMEALNHDIKRGKVKGSVRDTINNTLDDILQTLCKI